jgi:hypothetical protein
MVFAMACSYSNPVGSSPTSGETASAVSPGTTSSTDASLAGSDQASLANLPACQRGEPKAGIDLAYENIHRHYHSRRGDGMVSLIGDGPVRDPSLEPETDGTYANVAEWLTAAERVDDSISDRGYGFSEPFQLFIQRTNPGLNDAGISHLSLTLNFWLNQDCEFRVESGEVVSAPDPCRYAALYKPSEIPAGCDAPFKPRAGHMSVWTGDELLIFGGASGSHDVPPLSSGLAFNPDTVSWRDLELSPEVLTPLHAVWGGDRMLVVGWTDTDDDVRAVRILSYFPAGDTWSVSSPLPDDRTAIGATIWTGTEVILAGGDLNNPDDTAWAYNPAEATWRQLPDPGIERVEGMEGVWTGTEAIFYGGYTAQAASPGVAYNPGSQTWRHLPDASSGWIENHRLAWTGQQMIVYSGHTGPGHPQRILLYEPETNSWSESSPMPIAPRERLGGAWTGDQLIIWGGYATYGDHDEDGDAVYGDGASYDPATDTWTTLPSAPISDRCDHSATWTRSLLVVFGGMTTCGEPQILADGSSAAYDPARTTWQVLRP